uniref:Transmembrane protein n=1 Tax=Medicago truncatula TaxID=3880 RepID=I3SQ53_MEDTR|nr:unknown [Medicago truncatula]
MGKIQGVGVCNYHNILNMDQNQMHHNRLGTFLRNGLVQIALLGPLDLEGQPNHLHRGFFAMLFLWEVRLVLMIVLCFVIGVV